MAALDIRDQDATAHQLLQALLEHDIPSIDKYWGLSDEAHREISPLCRMCVIIGDLELYKHIHFELPGYSCSSSCVITALGIGRMEFIEAYHKDGKCPCRRYNFVEKHYDDTPGACLELLVAQPLPIVGDTKAIGRRLIAMGCMPVDPRLDMRSAYFKFDAVDEYAKTLADHRVTRYAMMHMIADEAVECLRLAVSTNNRDIFDQELLDRAEELANDEIKEIARAAFERDQAKEREAREAEMQEQAQMMDPHPVQGLVPPMQQQRGIMDLEIDKLLEGPFDDFDLRRVGLVKDYAVRPLDGPVIMEPAHAELPEAFEVPAAKPGPRTVLSEVAHFVKRQLDTMKAQIEKARNELPV